MKGTVQASRVIDSECRASIDSCGGEMPAVLRQRCKGLSAEYCPNRFSSKIPGRSRRHSKGCRFFHNRHKSRDILALPSMEIALQQCLCHAIRLQALSPFSFMSMVLLSHRAPCPVQGTI